MNLKIENKPQIYRLTNTNLDSRRLGRFVHAGDAITARDSDRIKYNLYFFAVLETATTMMIIERDYDEIDNLAELRKH